MLRQIMALAIKDIKLLFKSIDAALTLFLMPAIFILIMTEVMSGFVGNSDRNKKPFEVLLVDADGGRLASKAIQELEGLDGLHFVQEYNGSALTRVEAEQLIMDHVYNMALVIPDGFTHSFEADQPAASLTIPFIVDPALPASIQKPVQGHISGVLHKVVYVQRSVIHLRQGFDSAALGRPRAEQALIQDLKTQFLSSLEAIEKDPEVRWIGLNFETLVPENYQQPRIPKPEEISVPAYALFGVFFIMSFMATNMHREKEGGTFRRLLVAPASRKTLILGKLLPYFLTNLVQLVLMFAFGWIFYDLDLSRDVGALVMVSISASLAAVSLGLVTASLCRNADQAGSVSSLITVSFSAIGGLFVPSFVMPEAVRYLGYLTPHYWANWGFQDVLVRGLGAADVVLECTVLLLIAFFGILFGVWRFRFD